MDGLARAVEASDSPWALGAIFLIGIYVLLWRYGGEMLRLSRDSNRVANEAKVEAATAARTTAEIQTSIITNHGSANLGDAIDRLTEWAHLHAEAAKQDRENLVKMERTLLMHLNEADVAQRQIQKSLAELHDLNLPKE